MNAGLVDIRDEECGERYAALRAREFELFRWYGYGWCRGLLGSDDWMPAGGGMSDTTASVTFVFRAHPSPERNWAEMEIGFHRGFPHRLRMSWSDWRTHAPALRAAVPGPLVELTDEPVGRAYADGGLFAFTFTEASGYGDYGETIHAAMVNALQRRWPAEPCRDEAGALVRNPDGTERAKWAGVRFEMATGPDG